MLTQLKAKIEEGIKLLKSFSNSSYSSSSNVLQNNPIDISNLAVMEWYKDVESILITFEDIEVLVDFLRTKPLDPPSKRTADPLWSYSYPLEMYDLFNTYIDRFAEGLKVIVNFYDKNLILKNGKFYNKVFTDLVSGTITFDKEQKKFQLDSNRWKLWKVLLINEGKIVSYESIAKELNQKRIYLDHPKNFKSGILASTKKNLITSLATLGISSAEVRKWFIDDGNGIGLAQ